MKSSKRRIPFTTSTRCNTRKNLDSEYDPLRKSKLLDPPCLDEHTTRGVTSENTIIFYAYLTPWSQKLNFLNFSRNFSVFTEPKRLSYMPNRFTFRLSKQTNVELNYKCQLKCNTSFSVHAVLSKYTIQKEVKRERNKLG
jgi:hypothetical protein